MRTVALGNTGVEVSAFCLGTMYFGSRTEKRISYQLLDQYVEAGGSFLDTANTYARWVPGFKGGESETLLGEWMRERRNRSQMFVATKVGFPYPGAKGGLRARQIEVECEKSLQRLGIGAIDLYYAHVDDRNAAVEETNTYWLHLSRKTRSFERSASGVYEMKSATTSKRMSATWARTAASSEMSTRMRFTFSGTSRGVRPRLSR